MKAKRRIQAGLIAFACGDAAGVPWETERPDQIDTAKIRRLPCRHDWPLGAVSDDTVFLLSTARTLASGKATPHALLKQLAADLPDARGAGRTSRAAIERFLASGLLQAEIGTTNGAAARALPIGWASAAEYVEPRVRLGIELARTTHGEASAIAAAVAVAAMGSWSVEGEPLEQIVAHALDEARMALDVLGAPIALLAPVEQAARAQWQPPEEGVPFLGIETVAAVVTVVGEARSTEECIIRAVCLGGDTDTCAAIAGGVFATATGDDAISWRDSVPLLADSTLTVLARSLTHRRWRSQTLSERE